MSMMMMMTMMLTGKGGPLSGVMEPNAGSSGGHINPNIKISDDGDGDGDGDSDGGFDAYYEDLSI